MLSTEESHIMYAFKIDTNVQPGAGTANKIIREAKTKCGQY